MLAVFVGACETGTEPGGRDDFDAQRALEDHQAMDVVLDSDVMGAFRALGAGITPGSMAPEAGAALRIGGALGPPEALAPGGSFVGDLLRAASGLGEGPYNNPIISVFRRGKTFSYDPDLGRYVIDEGREGAPATGVRFILYRPAPGGRPDPSAPVGYADLVDEGDDSVEEIALRLVVVEGSDTLLHYLTTLDVMDRGGRITVTGFLQGEVDRLDFEIGIEGSAKPQGTSVEVDFEMGIASRDFLITGSVSGAGMESGRGGEIQLLVKHGSDSFQVDASGATDSIDGSFYLNGELFARVTGDPDDPVFTGGTGSPLTWIEVLVLRQIIDSSEDVFDFLEDLLDPVDELVILAIIL
jgi:hypothetical protein